MADHLPNPPGAAPTAIRPAILIPALDAAPTIDAVVTDARRHCVSVVVVDDGSGDDTAQQAQRAGAEVVRHPTNRGKGAALVTGMRHLAASNVTHALTMDADGQHLATEVPKLLAAARGDPDAIIVGARTIGDQAVASANLLGNRVANLAVRVASGVCVDDTQSGFRVYPIARVLALPLDGGRFEYETTMLIHATRAGIPVRSVPIAVYYPPIAERRSHYRKIADTVRIIRAVAPLLVRR
jgi:glycosyltransferase involved in cell wall biosynthesis